MASFLLCFILILVIISGVISGSCLQNRHLLQEEKKPVVVKKKMEDDHSTKNQTKAISSKLGSSTKNQTKTKLLNTIDPETQMIQLKPKIKKLNSTMLTDLGAGKNNKTGEALSTNVKKMQKKKQPISSNDEDDDLVKEFRELPSKFQETIVPDLQRISKTTKSYLNRYNKEVTKGFKPYVGNKHASTIASIVSFGFIIIPLILVSLIFNRIKAHFSLQKILIFIQIYLAIYFSILCLSSLITGLEPLRFFYTSSQSTYVCVQLLQTLSYVLYLLLLLMYLILVFSTKAGLGTRLLSLGYTFVGFAVGLHYYMTVFHRAILRQLPKTSWKIHALYAASFVLICLLGRFDRRPKKLYFFEDGEDEGKKN